MATNKFYLVSLPTQQHASAVYVGCDSPNPKATLPNKWFITEDSKRACAFPNEGWAREFTAQLNESGEAYGLKNDGHQWRIVREV